jgi:hypothetical protein
MANYTFTLYRFNPSKANSISKGYETVKDLVVTSNDTSIIAVLDEYASKREFMYKLPMTIRKS